MQATIKRDDILERHPLAAYFLLTFLISWAGALAIAAPYVLRNLPISRTAGILTFPVMLLGPSISGIYLTWLTEGKDGIHGLLARVCRWQAAPQWYAFLLLPPAAVLLILFVLKWSVSNRFSPNHFYLGILFGIPAGILEEIGWMGYAYPKMILKWNAFSAAVFLGLLWSFWHLPAINFLGAAAPHGSYWFAFFLAFALAMTAMRVLICWQYLHTKSLFLAQLMHISSTGTLVIFSPPVTPAQEAMWYALYGCLLWVAVGFVRAAAGRELH